MISPIPQPRLFEGLLRMAGKTMTSINAPAVSSILVAAAQLGLTPAEKPHLSFFIQTFQRNPASFAARDLCNAAWAVSVLQQWGSQREVAHVANAL